MDKHLDYRQKLAYGIGNFGYSTVASAISSYIMFFSTVVLGIPGSLVGIAIAISTLWDSVTDPLAGVLCDNAKNQWLGKRQNFMFFACISMCIFSFLIWNLPLDYPVGLKFFYLMVFMLVFETSNTLFATPYTALGFDLSTDSKQATSMQAYRSVFYLLGMIMPSLLMFFFMPNEVNAPRELLAKGYSSISIVCLLLCLTCGMICIFGTRKNTHCLQIYEKKREKINFFSNLTSIIREKNLKLIIAGYTTAMLSSAIITSVGFHFFTYTFHFSSLQLSSVMLALISGAILSQAFVTKLSNKNGKVQTILAHLTIIMIGVGIVATCFVLRGLLSFDLLYVISLLALFVCGYGTGALYSLPFVLFFDELNKTAENKNKTATYSGLLTFSYKIANSMSLLIIGFLLDAIKFNSSEPVVAIKVQNGLGRILLYGVSIALAMSLLIFSKLKNKHHKL